MAPGKKKGKYTVIQNTNLRNCVNKKTVVKNKAKSILPKLFKINPENGEINMCKNKRLRNKNSAENLTETKVLKKTKETKNVEKFRYLDEDEHYQCNITVAENDDEPNFESKVAKKAKKGKKKNKCDKECTLDVEEDCTTNDREITTEIEVPIKDNIKSILHSSKGDDFKVKKNVSFSIVGESAVDNIVAPKKNKKAIKLAKFKKKRRLEMLEKKKKKKQLNTIQSVKPNPIDRKSKAISYLHTWKHDKSNWKFEKLTQLWLLKNMFNKTEVSDRTFKIFVKYAIDLKGSARNVALLFCESLITKAQQKNKDGNDCNPNTDDVSYSRACSLLKHLQKKSSHSI